MLSLIAVRPFRSVPAAPACPVPRLISANPC
jgi:hypothetical protein